MNNLVLYFILTQLILLVPSYYFYRWILRRTVTKNVGFYSNLLVVSVPIILVFVFIQINNRYIEPWIRSDKFDSSAWQNDNEGRYRMVKELIESNILNGKTKDEVYFLLGKGNEDGPCNNCVGYPTNDPDQGLSIDHEVLEVNFNEEDRVVSVRKNAW